MRLNKVLRRWLPPVRRRTVLAGIVLGALLPPLLILAGTIGISPLPDQPSSPRRAPDASGGALSATQREVRRSLLSPSDLPPGYRPVGGSPSAAPAAGGGQAERPGTPPAAPAQGPLEFLPELPDLVLDPDDGDPPGGQPELGHQPGPPPETGPPNGQPGEESPGAPSPGEQSPGMPLPGAPPPGTPTPGTPTPGTPTLESAGPDGPANLRHLAAARRAERDRPETGGRHRAGAPGRCRNLLVAPWTLVAGSDPAGPQRAEFVDRDRGVRVWQALGTLPTTGAERAVELIRRTAAACRRFDTALPRDRRVDAGRGDTGRAAGGSGRADTDRRARVRNRLTVTIDAADAAYPMRFTAVTGDGRTWTGYLAVDRVGPVLSLLSHVGPRDAVTLAEATADRRTALGKARPLARRLA